MSDATLSPDPVPAAPVASPAPSAVGADRTISPVSGRLGGMGAKAVTLAALIGGCGVFVFATAHHGPTKSRSPLQPASQVVAFEPAKPDDPTPLAPTLAKPGLSAPSLDPNLAGTNAAQVPVLQPDGAPGSAQPSAQTPAQAAAQARAAKIQAIRSAPILAFNQNGGSSLSGAGLDAAPFAKVEAVAAHTPTELDQLRQGSTIGLAHASRLPDRNFLITAGTSIPCTLQTAMDTSTPGYVSCLIGQDVYSENGAVILMEKGSKVLGEYHSGIKQGQARLFVLWSRVVTPSGVAIGLASPASDALGRAGFDGTIDNHFWERFGGALLLSIVDDTAAAVASRADSNGETVRVPSDAAGIALQNSINIPPSLKKNQGSQVAIFAAQDLDFSTVYALKAR
jgi:type IV secretion system protein VirB10